jgi:hypothetical protein
MRKMFDIRRSSLDESGNRVLEIALPAVSDHLDDVRRALRAKGGFALHYDVRCGEHHKHGSIDLDSPQLTLVFESGVDPDGVWELTIEGVADDGKWTRELWRQGLFIQKKLRLTHERIDELARRYAPVFLFSGAEEFYPVSLQTLLSSPEVKGCSDVMKLKTIFGREKVPLPELGDFMRFNGHSEYLLDFNFLSMRRSIFATLGGDPTAATIYYSYIEDPASDRFFISYHLIYAFDTKAGIAKLSGIGPHVFDRESMVMVFEGGEEPASMIISGHLENQTISFLQRSKSWTQGRIRVPFDHPATLRVGCHPVIAVAQGSHALYPTSGVYQLSLLREIAGYLDAELMPEEASRREDRGTSSLSPEQVMMPPALASKVLSNYHIASLGLDRMTSRIEPDAAGYDGYNAYLTFSGFWVDVPGTRNARFPPFTRKVSEIRDWVDGAYDWSWDDIPERYHRNNGLILKFLHENVEDF